MNVEKPIVKDVPDIAESRLLWIPITSGIIVLIFAIGFPVWFLTVKINAHIHEEDKINKAEFQFSELISLNNDKVLIRQNLSTEFSGKYIIHFNSFLSFNPSQENCYLSVEICSQKPVQFVFPTSTQGTFENAQHAVIQFTWTKIFDIRKNSAIILNVNEISCLKSFKKGYTPKLAGALILPQMSSC